MLICVGLAVDYAAHIAHMFKDTRSQRLPGVSLVDLSILLNSGEVFENSIQRCILGEQLSDAMRDRGCVEHLPKHHARLDTTPI